jgi:putative oxidoreductase
MGPLFARIIVGYVFMKTGFTKLENLESIIENFKYWGIPYAEFTTPLVAYFEAIGGLFIIAGFLTRISSAALSVIMAVAIISVKISDIDSLETLFGFEESTYFAVFCWLAISGPGKASFDHLITRKIK